MPSISTPIAKLRAFGARLKAEGGVGIRNRIFTALFYPRWLRLYSTQGTASSTSSPPQPSQDSFPRSPVFSVILPVFNSDPRLLRQAIDSVLLQSFQHWELCIADDCSVDPSVGELLKEYTTKEHRIKSVRLTTNSHISAATNAAAALATGDYLAFLDHDDALAPEALQRAWDVLSRSSTIEILYTDEDKITPHGRRHRPHFKPDFNQELLLSYNYICHLMIVRRSTFNHHGGMRIGFEGAQDWDLALRITESSPPNSIHHIPEVLYHWRTTPHSTASAGAVKSYALDAGMRAVSEHLSRRGLRTAQVRRSSLLSAVEVDYPFEKESTSVSVLVVSRSRAELIPKLPVDGTLAIEYILAPATPEGVLPELNKAAARASGKIVVVLFDPIEYQSNFTHQLLSSLLRPDIGCVGGLALDRRRRIVSGGIIRGIGGVGDYIMRGVRAPTVSQFGRAALPQDISAVGLACFAVRAEDLARIGGFPEALALGVDAELAIGERLRSLGKRIIFNPRASLIIGTSPYASDSRPASHILDEDPFYNPNLSARRADFSLAWPPRRQHHPGR